MVGFGKEGLIKPLFKKAKKQDNIEILFETEVKRLVMDGGRRAPASSPRTRTATPSAPRPRR